MQELAKKLLWMGRRGLLHQKVLDSKTIISFSEPGHLLPIFPEQAAPGPTRKSIKQPAGRIIMKKHTVLMFLLVNTSFCPLTMTMNIKKNELYGTLQQICSMKEGSALPWSSRTTRKEAVLQQISEFSFKESWLKQRKASGNDETRPPRFCQQTNAERTRRKNISDRLSKTSREM